VRRLLCLFAPGLLVACVTQTAVAPAPELAGPSVEPPAAPASRPASSRPALPAALPTFRSTTIPGGLACLIRLRELGVEHASLPALKGVLTPVRVGGPINGIRLRSLGRSPLVADCRLVLALHRAAPYLLQMGVEELHFSSSYRYSLMPSGRLSQHAMGLAIDVHKVTISGELLSVEEDFVLGLGADACGGASPPLNRMACLLRAWGLFDWVLTPDFDRAHRNHFHLDIYCLHRRRFPPKEAPAEVVFD
jgi:hypothetical protein